jgi:rhodanese-related sulfurtransferase
MAATARQMVDSATSRIRNLMPIEVEAHLLAQDAVLVDVREPEELEEHGRIVGAVHAPRGLLEFWADPASPLHRPELDPASRTIVYCDAGSRSALAVETLETLGYRDVAHLDGGIAAWKRAGLPVAGLASWHRLTDARR